MNDLITPRRSRRSRLVLLGSALFGLLALAVAVDAIRGGPPLPGDAVSPRDAAVYRVCAAAICALIAVWIFLAGGPRREDRPSLLR